MHRNYYLLFGSKTERFSFFGLRDIADCYLSEDFGSIQRTDLHM